MSLSSLYDVALGLLALVGVAAIATVLMLAWPVRPPPPASIHSGAREIDETGAPDLSRYQARDGTWLVARFSQIEGYRCLSLMRAFGVVKCQWALA